MTLFMLEELGDSREAVGARLKAVREALSLSKREFAERAGVSEQNYGPFENGKRDLSLSVAKQFRKVYKLPLDFMYFGNSADLPHRIAKKL